MESFEGLRLMAYQDQRGIWTIGYGHTGPEVYPGLEWTQARADLALASDLHTAENAVNSHITLPITQNQFDALVSLAYNIGVHAFESSTLVKLLNSGDKLAAAAQFLQWSHVDGTVNVGLMHRRVAERDLFMTPESV